MRLQVGPVSAVALVAAAWLGGCQCGTEAPALRVTVTYSGFEPACVRVTASNPDGSAERSTTVPVPAGSREGQLLVAVFREPAWDQAQTLLISVNARELDCNGPVVAFDSKDVTAPLRGQTREETLALAAADQDGDGYVASPPGRDCADGDPRRHPGVLEVCDSLDQDCNGSADETFVLGLACDGGGCAGQTRCLADGGVGCIATGTLDWYPDSDMDGWGRTADQILVCVPPSGYVRNPDDCDDGLTQVRPGAPEICDGRDNNCEGRTDEGFNVDAGCMLSGGCSGVFACQPGGGVACRITGPGAFYPDEDEDGAGAASAPVCGTPDGSFVMNGDDCDDGDPFTAAGFPEICDRRDNDCDGVADRVAADGGNPCPANPIWRDYNIGGGGHASRGVWSWTDGGAWVVTLGDHMEFKLPGAAAFTARDCTGDWQGVWADPATGHAYAVGDPARLVHNTGSVCTIRSITGTPSGPSAIVGFSGGGAISLYVVGTDGGTALWDGGGGVQALDPVTGVRLVDIHGTSPDVMFAAGIRTASPAEPRLYRFQAPQAWNEEALPGAVVSSRVSVEGVHVVGPRLAYAVTDGGHVLRWTGDTQGWALHPAPDAGVGFRAVLAFGTSSVFALAPLGLWEWDGGTWTRLFTSSQPLHDLHGTNPADIWVVGDDGTVLHWPQ